LKPQRLDQFNQNKTILDLFENDKLNNLEAYQKLELYEIENTPIQKLSGGEKQRLSIFLTFAQKANLYIFDEPTNYLDIRQRLKVAQMIRDLATSENYVLVVDHDITILDYTTDMIHIIYGQPGAYGIVSTVSGTSESINNFFDGYLPADNVRFRDQAYTYCLNLEVSSDDPELEINDELKNQYLEYPAIKIDYPSFSLEVPAGKLLKSSTINLILGPNGSGKSSFLKSLLNTEISYSYKPQYPEETFKNPMFKELTALNLLYEIIPKTMADSGFKSQVVDALDISGFKDHLVNTLSGGEQQKLALIVCLGKVADCYFIDEPSASLDIEERVKAMKVIKRFLVHNQKMGFIVEHDITMAFSLTKDVESRVLVFNLESENEKRKGYGSLPTNCLDGLNTFLESIGVTFRMSTFSDRYRINRLGSGRDQEQKKNKKYIV
jgi:ATP-binding cassette subfamily E protein 1